MKIVAKELKNALKRIKRAVPGRSTIPILDGVRIAAVGGNVLLTTTNLEITLTTTLNAETEIEEEGGLVVDYGRLVEIASKANDEVTISDAENGVDIVAGEINFRLPLFPLEDYPAITNGEKIEGKADVSGLSGAMKSCNHFMSKELTRHFLNGVYLHSVAGELHAVATNGRILRKMVMGQGYPDNMTLLFPTTACVAISSLKDVFDEAHLSWTKNRCMIQGKNVLLVTRLITPQYPNYDTVINGIEKEVSLSVERKPFVDAMKTVTWWKNRGNGSRHGVVIETNGDHGKITLTSDTVENRASTTISGEWDHPIRFSLDPHMMYAIMKDIEAERVTLETRADGLGPISVVGDENVTTVIMPRKIVADEKEEVIEDATEETEKDG